MTYDCPVSQIPRTPGSRRPSTDGIAGPLQRGRGSCPWTVVGGVTP